MTHLSGLDGPCGVALDASDDLYVAGFHGSVRRFGPEPGFPPGPALADASHATGVAVGRS